MADGRLLLEMLFASFYAAQRLILEELMIRIREAVIVEGKYDKIKLSSLIDGLIIETKGFGIFRIGAARP